MNIVRKKVYFFFLLLLPPVVLPLFCFNPAHLLYIKKEGIIKQKGLAGGGRGSGDCTY